MLQNVAAKFWTSTFVKSKVPQVVPPYPRISTRNKFEITLSQVRKFLSTKVVWPASWDADLHESLGGKLRKIICKIARYWHNCKIAARLTTFSQRECWKSFPCPFFNNDRKQNKCFLFYENIIGLIKTVPHPLSSCDPELGFHPHHHMSSTHHDVKRDFSMDNICTSVPPPICIFRGVSIVRFSSGRLS